MSNEFMNIKVGDRIRKINPLSSLYHVKGTIQSVRSSGARCKVLFDNGEERNFLTKNLHKHSELIKPETPQFKVGDRVQHVGYPFERRNGWKGVIYEVKDTGVAVKWDEHPRADGYSQIGAKLMLKPLPPETPQFKVGDRVRNTGALTPMLRGVKGKVTITRRGGEQVYVKWDGGEYASYTACDSFRALELLEPETKHKQDVLTIDKIQAAKDLLDKQIGLDRKLDDDLATIKLTPYQQRILIDQRRTLACKTVFCDNSVHNDKADVFAYAKLRKAYEQARAYAKHKPRFDYYYIPTNKEHTMKKTFETVHYFQGHDIAGLDKEQIFDAIIELEGRIERLENIKTESKLVRKEIKRLNKALTKLVEQADAR